MNKQDPLNDVDLELFMQDLEEDPELRAHVHLYKDRQAQSAFLQAVESFDKEDLQSPETRKDILKKLY